MPSYQRGDVTLHYELDGAGPPAVYICGFGSHSNDYLGLMVRQALSQPYTLLTIDNRGAGQTITDGRKATFIDMADDIVAIMDHLKMEAAPVLGISMGGMIGLTLAVRYPHRVRSQVIAVSSAYSLPEPNRSAYFLRKSREMRERDVPLEVINSFNAFVVLGEGIFADYPALVDALLYAPPDPLAMKREGFDLQMGALAGYDVREQLKHLNIPTLVLSSPDDLLVPPRFQDEMAQLIPNADIKRYPGGHVFMMLPMYSAQFFEDVLSYWSK